MAVFPPDPLFCLKADMGHIHSIAFVDNTDNYTDTLVAATENGMVYFWDLESLRLKYKQEMGNSIQAIHIYNDLLITQEKSGMVKQWTMRTNKYEILNTYQCATGFCKSIIIDGNLILPQDNYTLDVIAIENFELIKSFKAQRSDLGQIMCIQKVRIDGNCNILAGFESGDVLLWDYMTEKLVSEIKLRECLTSITFDEDKLRGVCGNASNILQIFTIDKKFQITLKCEITITNEGCNVVKLRPDGKIFICGGWDGRLRIYSWKSLRLLVVLNEHREGVTDVQYSKYVVKHWEGKRDKIIAAASADGIISLWSLYN